MNFADYVGANLMFNIDSDEFGSAWGGSAPLNRDGVSMYHFTWMHKTGYHTQWVLAHEMGHGFGLPHSSGPYGETYDSYWDVMSGGGAHRFYHYGNYGYYGVHLISYHKDLLGWIPVERKYLADVGTSRTLTIERLGELPGTTGAYLMAKIPLPGSSTRYYTVEARRKLDNVALNDYEEDLPGTGTETNNTVYEGILIHFVDTTRERPAQVVDPNDDSNQNVNDLSAVWTPGEVFTDAANQIQVTVQSATASGYVVEIINGQPLPQYNDNFATPTIITTYPFQQSQDTTIATAAGDDPEFPESCVGAQGVKGYATVWFKYIPPATGRSTINTTGSDYDTMLGVWKNTANGLVNVSCNDDEGGNGASALTKDLYVGTTYYIEVAGKSTGGSLTLSFNMTPCYSLTTKINPLGAGSVIVNTPPNCAGELYLKNTAAQVTAQPTNGFLFSAWSGAVTGSENPTNLSMTTNQTVKANFLPAAPMLLSPVNGSVAESLRPTLDWSDVPGAEKYSVQLASDSGFATIVFSATPSSSEATPPSDLQRNSPYFWRVQTYSGGLWSDWSAPFTFTSPDPPDAPTLLTPSDKSVLGVLTPAFDWSDTLPAPGGGYQIQVSTSAAFTSTSIDTAIPDSNFTPGAPLENNARYYWHVRAYNASGHYSNWSAVFSFSTLPAIPALLEPEEGEKVNSLQPIFDWEDSPGGAKSYQIQIGKDLAFTNIINSGSPILSNYTPSSSLPKNTALYWRVRAIGLYGTGAWTNPRSFLTPDPPSVPALLSPLNGAVVSGYLPAFDWKDSTAASGLNIAGYQIQISSSSQFNTLILDQTAILSAFIPAVELPAGTIYWHVRAFDEDGVYSNWSSAWKFLTPAAVSGIVVDAYTGLGLNGATVGVSGTAISTTTNAEGQYTLLNVPAGSKSLVASKDGYVALAQTLKVVAGKTYQLKYQLVTAGAPSGTYRVVLTWETSIDLDAHLWLPSATPFHIHWDNMGGLGSFPDASLQRDDRDGYGPETMVIDQLYSGDTIFAVYLRGSGTFKLAQAVVRIYNGDILVKTLKAPAGSGRWWKAFKINSSGKLTIQNSVVSSSPGPYDPNGGAGAKP